MLSRTLEPEVMDTPEEAQDYDAMDHAGVNRLFVDDLLAATATAAAGQGLGDVLDLGTGTARIPIELCSRDADCRVLAVDAAIAMLDIARLNVEIAGLNTRIQLDKVDAKEMPYEEDSFDAIISNSIIHHIPEPLAVMREAVRVLKPGGLLFVRDLLRPKNEQQLEALVATYAGDEVDHACKMFTDSLRAALTVEEVQGMAEQVGIAPDCVQPTSDRHWTLVTRRE